MAVVHIPWYATLFRGDRFEEALSEIAPIALRHGATDYRVYRSHDDAYRYLQMATFERKVDFERYWYGEDFALWRADYSGWYTVPVLYVWHELVVQGSLEANASPAQAGPSSAPNH
jgi:hypothetical protein